MENKPDILETIKRAGFGPKRKGPDVIPFNEVEVMAWLKGGRP